MGLQNEIISTKSFFQNLNIPLSNDWLECCINWVKEQRNGQCTESELRSSVYDQWLIFDLRELKLPQLPPNVTTIEKLVFQKPLALQMMSIIDISRSKLQQLNDIRNTYALTRGFDEDNSHETTQIHTTSNNNNKRMLQMTLTDGVQEITGFEYKPIPCLNLNLPPGIKVFIKHPVTLRKGTLMLEPQHVQLLGGEVEDILITHAAENILAKSLNLPINPKPRLVNDKTKISQVIFSEITPNTIKTNLNDSNKKNEKIVKSNDISDDTKSKIKHDKIKIKNSFNEPDLSDEIDDLLEIEKELQQLEQGDIKNEPKHSNSTNILNSCEELNLADLTDDFFTPWENEDMPKAESNTLENEDRIYTLTELKEIIAADKHGTYTTFAKFKTVVQKLTIKDDVGWYLQISIEAENDELTVSVHNRVVAEMTGRTSEQMLELKKRVQTKDEEATSRIMKALEDLRLKLQNLNSLLEIEFKGDEKDGVPCIVKIL